MSENLKAAFDAVVGAWGNATQEQKDAVTTALPALAEALTAQQSVIEAEAAQA